MNACCNLRNRMSKLRSSRLPGRHHHLRIRSSILLSSHFCLLHFIKSQFQWIEKQKKQFDCLCLTGDLLSLNTDDLEEQTNWITLWIKSLDKQVFICSGNHDLDDFGECDWINNIQSKKICIDNQVQVFKGIKFGCIPYLGANLSDFYDCDILLNHVPPYKTKTSTQKTTGKEWGDPEIYDAIKNEIIRPHYLLCGHVHNPINKKDQIYNVKIINPGTQPEGLIPSHKIISIFPKK